MGKLIPIPANSGPTIKITYEGTGKDQKCFIDCECGARMEIESFRHSWSIIETRVRWEQHLKVAHQPLK